VRVFKTRSLAAESCRSGNVEINGHPAKPARDVRAGEVVNVRQGLMLRTFRVLGIPESRVGARLVPGYAEDRTSPEELAKARERSVQQLLARERGSGRPTKKDRRALEDLFGAD
jgi:ribosome-associated heat shock protein Hsp15